MISDTGLMVYTQHGCDAWAKKFGGKKYENNLGIVSLDERISKEVSNELILEVLPYHNLEVMIDGKDRNLDDNYLHYSTKPREQVYTKPWIAKKGDKIRISKGEKIKIVKK